MKHRTWIRSVLWLISSLALSSACTPREVPDRQLPDTLQLDPAVRDTTSPR